MTRHHEGEARGRTIANPGEEAGVTMNSTGQRIGP